MTRASGAVARAYDTDPERRFGEQCWYDETTGCVEWMGRLNLCGYGEFSVGGTGIRAHRWAYGENNIPAGFTIDHLCRNRSCQNPEHMEPVTNADNVLRGNGHTAKNARKTVCVRGHALCGDNVNTRHRPGRKPFRECRKCRVAYLRVFYQRHRESLMAKAADRRARAAARKKG